MKNLLSTTLASLILVLFISTNLNAQALWSEWGNNNQHIKSNSAYQTVMIGGQLNAPGSSARLFVDGAGDNAIGIEAYTYGAGNHAIYGHSGGGGALAGYFFGNVEVDGLLTAQDLAINNLTSNFLQTNLIDAAQVESNHIQTNTLDADTRITIGEEMSFAPNVDALLQVKTTDAYTYGIQASATDAVAVGGTSANASGVSGFSTNSYGVSGSSLNDIGVFGYSTLDIGIKGESENGMAILGSAANGIGVKGISGNSHGGYFETVDGPAALYAYDRDGGGLAAHFEGNVKLNGSITGNVHAGGVRIETPQGYYTEIGPFNQWNSHFRTDRPQFYFYQKVRSAAAMYATGFHVTSDKRLKENVSEFEYGLDEILQLNPLTYDYTGKGGTTSGDYNVGLFAQDLQKVAPEFVTEFTHRDFDEAGEVKSKKDYLQVYDTGIKYMLVNATKEQQEIIDEQAAKIETLEETLAELQATVETLIDGTRTTHTQTVELNGEEGALAQNQPNPFSNNTLIKYDVPKNATNAVITIFNINGQKMHQERITQTGRGEIQLQAKNLTAGTYSYTLTIDGNIIDSKQMVITK